MKISNR
jgi:hypothetical protein